MKRSDNERPGLETGVQVRPDVRRLAGRDRTDPPNPGCGFYLEPPAGTVTWVSDSTRRPDVAMRLPSRPAPADAPELPELPELHRVTVVTLLAQAAIDIRLLVLTDPAGRVLASSSQAESTGFDRMWPTGRLDVLQDHGIELDSVVLPHRKALQHSFPGSARWWWLTTFCPVPGLMEALIPREDGSHGGTEEVPGRASGAGDPDGGGPAAGPGDQVRGTAAGR